MIGETLAAATASAAVYAVVAERRWLQITRRDIPVPDLPEALDGLTIAHLSDVHYGPFQSLELLRRWVARANALNADLVALTGDFVDRRPSEIGPMARELGGLRAPHGVWAVLGGHDVRASETRSYTALREQGIQVLRNSASLLVGGSVPLWIVGVRDNSEYFLDRLDVALTDVPEGARTLLLAHSPDIAWEAAARGVDLVLSGHTHGGQICAPLYGPIVTELRIDRRFARGLQRVGRTWVFTTRGLGVVRLPARFLSRPEIALLRLVRAAAEPPTAPEGDARAGATVEQLYP